MESMFFFCLYRFPYFLWSNSFHFLCHSHSSGQWKNSQREVICVSKCSLYLPCQKGYFCSRITGDKKDFGRCIQAVTCPRSPVSSNGILSPDATGVLGSKAIFRCPTDKNFSMVNHKRRTFNNASVDIKCTHQGWKLSDGSNGEVPICIRGSLIENTKKNIS